MLVFKVLTTAWISATAPIFLRACTGTHSRVQTGSARANQDVRTVCTFELLLPVNCYFAASLLLRSDGKRSTRKRRREASPVYVFPRGLRISTHRTIASQGYVVRGTYPASLAAKMLVFSVSFRLSFHHPPLVGHISGEQILTYMSGRRRRGSLGSINA